MESKNVRAKLRKQHALQYAHKPKPVMRDSPEVISLKKLTAKVLNELKSPSAVPSQVILAALLKAKDV